ncbi:beta strand repeat-containing protein [Nitratireductor rhodophyticola]|uniref:beta strand repeat-containing protein n=1 Tax=Nitratireductor rhodophyticola TaxID=2854036 RepID=UPI003BA93C2F
MTVTTPQPGDDGTTVYEKGLAERGAEPAGSGESADGDGTDNDDPSEATSGTVTFTAPDGVQSVSVAGTALALGDPFPQTVSSDATGTLVVTGYSYNAVTGQGSISYTYTLTDNTLADPDGVSFGVTVTDADGDSQSGTIAIAIIDDAPVAVADTDSIGAGQFGPATGNVITDAEGDGGADTVGADDASVVGVAAGNTGADLDDATSGNPATVGTVIQGTYGKLTLNADGSYSYTRDAGTAGGVSDVFTYTLKDGDGDLTHTTLTIDIGDSGVTVTTPQPGDDGTTVYEKGLAERGAEPAGSGESTDGDGTDNDDPSEATSGTVTFTAPDGVQSVSVAGTALALGDPFPQTVSSDATGTLVVTGYSYNAVTGQGSISYTYTLTDNTLADPDGVSFGVTVTDADGDSQSGTIAIAIVDDAPVAVADTDSIGAGQFGPATGNVITDAEGDGGADTVGADDASVVGVAAGNTGADLDDAGTVGTVIQGTYGKLTLNADGSYSYTRDAGTAGGVSDVFTYTLKDGDGDLTHTTLTIDIGDSGVTVTTPQPGDDGTTVYEKGLAERGAEPAGSGESADGDGTDNDDPSEATSGTVTFTAPDGVQSVSVAGTALALGDPFPQTVSSDATGTLVVTGYSYNAVTGQGSISYTYTLTDNTLADPDGVSFGVTVTDADGDSQSGTIAIAIIDDAPVAVADTDSIGAGQFGPATGNVITDAEGDGGADTVGADDASVVGVAAGNTGADLDDAGTVGTVIQGTYGKLTLNADGSYSYTRDAGTAGGVSDVFTYTLKDGDGDLTHTTLTIDIGDSGVTVTTPQPGDDGTTVYEKGLAERGAEPAGSGESADGDGTDNDDPSEATSGTVTFTAPDGVQSVSVAGTALALGDPFPQTVSSDATGTLVVTGYSYNAVTGQGSISYTYTLTDNTLADPDGVSFGVTVTDADGDSQSGTIAIAIVDDAPVAVADTDSIGAGQFGPATGNVITDAEGDGGADTVGADDASVVGVAAGNTGVDLDNAGTVGTVIQGTYGKLTLNADGSYSYTRDAGTAGGVSDVFTYTLKDGDGDLTHTTLTIDIGNAPPEIGNLTPKADGGDVVVDEDDLAAGRGGGKPAGSDGSDSTTQSGTFTISSPDGIASLTIGGQSFITNGVFTAGSVTTGLGNTLNVTGYDAGTGVVSYSYTLVDNETHGAGAGENDLFEDFAVVLTDQDGQSANDVLSVKIVDDVPEAMADTDSAIEGGIADGNVLTGSGGSDANATDGVADIQGADGATVTSIVAITAGGSATNVGTNTVVNSQYGTLTISSDGSYSYQSTPGAVAGGTVQDVFTYTITDADGDPSTTTLTINVNDSGLATPDYTVTVNEAALDLNKDGDDLVPGTVTGSLPGSTEETSGGTASATGGTGPYTYALQTGGNAVTAGTYGSIQVNSDGTYTYTLSSNYLNATADDGVQTISGAESFTYVATDAFGNTTTGTISIDIIDDVPKAEAAAGETASVVLDESDGSGSGTDGINPGQIQAGVIQSLFATPDFGADGAGSVAYSFSATDGAATGLWLTGQSGAANEIRLVKVSDTVYEGRAGGAGGTLAFTVSINGATGAVTVTQHETLEHTVNGGPGAAHDDALFLGGAAAISVVQTVTDADGDTATATSASALSIRFDDDGPTVIVPEDAVLSNSAGTPQVFDLDLDGSVIDNYGADGAGTVRFTVTEGQDSGLTSGGQPITYHLSGNGTVLTGKIGGAGGTTVFTVTLDPANGTYSVDMDGTVDAFTQVDFDPGIYDFVGGNDPWAGFVPNGQDGNAPGGSPVDDNSRDLLLTPIGASGKSINGNAISAGVGGGASGQNIGAGEGIRLDFVHDLTGNPAGTPANYQGNPAQRDHLFDGHYTVNGAAVSFGDGSTNTTIRLSAFDDPDGNTVVGDGIGDNITTIVIAYDGENQVVSFDPLATYPTTVSVGNPGGLPDRSYTVDFVLVGGVRVAHVTGILDEQVTITSFTADGYNSLELLYISGDDFALTGFGTSVVSTDPVDFTLPIEIVDGDGDTAPAEIDVTLQPDPGPAVNAFSAEVNEAGLAGGSEEGTANTMDAGTLSVALASGDTLDALEVSDADGNWVDVTGGGTVQGKFGVLTVTADGSGNYSSSYQLNQNSLDHNVHPGKGTPEGVAERFNVRARDNDGDYSSVDTLKVDVLDDAPEAIADNASLTLGTENFNIAFVLDFSGSVDNSELDAMLDAVKAAGQSFFDGTSGNVQIELIAFSSSASAAGPFTDYASFAAQIDAWNPTEGGSRPYNGGTDFTAAIEETMDAYTPLSDHNNQVFFLSDGNPNEQIGAGGHSLYGSTQTAWNNFVQNNDVTVQTVGIGNNIDVEQLQDVDEADGSNVVVSVSNFDDLVTALLDLTNQVDVSGNVLLGDDNAAGGGDDDILGADGGRILSITVDGVTYTYEDGPDKIFNDGGQPVISGASLVVDGALGGELTFNFETGAWNYQADGGTTPGTESFDYVLVDNDGDTNGASLTIDILPPPGATDDVVLTNITDYSAIDIPTAALLHNDPAPAPTSPLSVDGASNPQNGGVSLAGDVTFTPSGTPVEFVDEDFSSGEGSFVYRDAYYPGTGSEADGFRSTSGPASGGALKIELGDGGSTDRYNVNGAFTRTFSLASAATVTITFDYYAMLTSGTDVGEDVRILAGMDGEAFGAGGIVDELLGSSGNGGGNAVTGWKTFTTTIDLSAGDHTLALGGLLTQKTASGEYADVYFDNVKVEYSPAPSFASGGFDYSVSDGSGFTDEAHVSVVGVAGSTITGTDADEVLVGNDSGSTLLGMGGNDSLVGGDAADLLDGGDGDDLLIGGEGADLLIGGEGQNTYDLTDIDNAEDTVVLDQSALAGLDPDAIIGFGSEDVVDLTELVSIGPGDNVADYVRLNPGNSTQLQVDADGTAGSDDWVTVATFDVPQTPSTIKILYEDDGSDNSGTV